MNKFFVGTLLGAATGVQAYDMPEFASGVQTGVFGEVGDDALVDYSCPELAPFMVRSSVHKYVAMASPVYNSAKYVLGRTHAPLMDLAYNSAESLDQALSVFGALYDGGDFCKGLLYSKIATEAAMNFAEYFRLH